MCGRDYSTYTEEELLLNYLNERGWKWPVNDKLPHFKPNYNMCPTQTGPVLSVKDGELSFRIMRWGLVPSWAKSVADADKYSMINARSEEIWEKRSYKSAVKKRRCIVPVSGFYEWRRTGKAKVPFAISTKDSPIMSIAGIWEEWGSKDSDEPIHSFSLITTSSNSFMEKIHDRMPVILAKENEERWLDPELSDESVLNSLMAPCPSENLQAHEVSTKVNSPRNNSPELLDSSGEEL